MLCSLGMATLTLGQAWTYDFSTGLDPYYWSFASSGSTTWTTSPTAGGLLMVGPAGGGGLSAGQISLDLTRFAPLGDFDARLTFTGAVFAAETHQLHLGVDIAGQGIYAVRSNEGDGLHMWISAYVDGGDGAAGADGTLRLSRTGSTLATFWNNSTTPFWSGDYGSTPAQWIGFNFMKNGATDYAEVTWQSFSLTPAPIPEPSALALAVGLLALGTTAGLRRRSR